MTSLFLASFIVGLILTVGAMLFGIERAPKPLPSGADAQGAQQTIRARLTVPNLGAFATLFGATGYLLHRYAGLGPAAVIVLAALLGVAGVAGASLLIARWALPGVAAEVVDERYVLQGHPARVTRVVQVAAGGTPAYDISYESGGRQHVVRAQTLDGSELTDGAEVVIERIENGQAYVESWTMVEKRL